MFSQSQQAKEHRREQLQQEAQLAEAEPQSTTPADAVTEDVDSATLTVTDDSGGMLDLLAQDVEVDVVEAQASSVSGGSEETVLLSNSFIEVEFTTRGGAILQVKFLQTKRGGLDDYIFNQDGFLPALSLSLQTGSGQAQEFDLNFAIASQSEDSITFVLDAGNGLVIQRSYKLAESASDKDPYIIEHSTSFANRDATPKGFRRSI